MVHYHYAVLSSIEHRMLEERLRLKGLALQIEDPSECIEVCRIVRLCLYGLLAHVVRLLELLSLHAEVVCIIVKDIYIVRVYLQSLVVCLVRLLVVAELMVDVSHSRPCPQCLRTVTRSDLQHLLAEVQHLVVFLKVVISHASHLQKGGLLRETLERLSAFP